MPADSNLEQTLRQLPQIGTLIKDRGYRQIWRFTFEDKAYYLKFYPVGGPRYRFRRFFRGSSALREFQRLQLLQKANIPAPRGSAVLLGFQINGIPGDAIVLDAIEPSQPLDQYLLQAEKDGLPATDHHGLTSQVIALVQQLARAGLGHEDLHLGNFLLSNGRVYLLDGYAVRRNGLRLNDLFLLGHSARRFATLTDLIRGWNALGPGSNLPASNPYSQVLWKRFMQTVTRQNRYFQKLESDDWQGIYCKRSRYPYRWSTVSALCLTDQDWAREWPPLLQKIQADQLPILKRTRSGDVLSATLTLSGQPIDVIIKRPRRRYWYRYLNEIGRGSRPMRAWKKSWQMIARELPTAWPLLVMEKRSMGYVTDAIFITEKIPGPTLSAVDLNSLPPSHRQMLLRRTGHILRQIERFGFAHFDAKPSNWIARSDTVAGVEPVMIDIDGIRHRHWTLLGLHRLLRGLRENPSYGSSDSLQLCQGYAPFAKLNEIQPQQNPV